MTQQEQCRKAPSDQQAPRMGAHACASPSGKVQLKRLLRGLAYDEQLAAIEPVQRSSPADPGEQTHGVDDTRSHAEDASGSSDSGRSEAPEPPARLSRAVARFERSQKGEEPPSEGLPSKEDTPADTEGESEPGQPRDAGALIAAAERARDRILSSGRSSEGPEEPEEAGPPDTDTSADGEATDTDMETDTSSGGAGHSTQMKIVQKRSATRGRELQAVQEKLNKLGFDCGAPDGIDGPETRAAVKAFQSKHRLEPDGVVGPKTLAALGMMPAGSGGAAHAPGATSARRAGTARPSARARVRRGARKRSLRGGNLTAAGLEKDKKFTEQARGKFAEIYKSYASKLSPEEQGAIASFMSSWVPPKVCPFVHNPRLRLQDKAILAGAMLAAQGREGRGQDCGDWVMKAYMYSQGDAYVSRAEWRAIAKAKIKKHGRWALNEEEYRWKTVRSGALHPKVVDLIEPGHWLAFGPGVGHSVLVVKVLSRNNKTGMIGVEVMEAGNFWDQRGNGAPRYNSYGRLRCDGKPKRLRTPFSIYEIKKPDKENAYKAWLQSRPKQVP